MIYVFEQGNVVYDGSTISQEEKDQAVAVVVLPPRNTPEGTVAHLRANKATETAYWEYIEHDELTKLRAQLEEVLAQLAAKE